MSDETERNSCRGQKHQRRKKQEWLMEESAALASSSVNALLTEEEEERQDGCGILRLLSFQPRGLNLAMLGAKSHRNIFKRDPILFAPML